MNKLTGILVCCLLLISAVPIAAQNSRHSATVILEWTTQDFLDFSLIDTWNLEAVKTGPRQWPVFDDYRDDPDLPIPAPQKTGFHRELEKLAGARMLENIAPHLKGR